MSLQTLFDADGLTVNHNQTVIRPTPYISYQHNQTMIQTAPKVWPQHNQTLVLPAGDTGPNHCLTIVPLGDHSPHHNQWLVGSTAPPRITANHSQTLRIVR
jgi:hypothetical protein